MFELNDDLPDLLDDLARLVPMIGALFGTRGDEISRWIQFGLRVSARFARELQRRGTTVDPRTITRINPFDFDHAVQAIEAELQRLQRRQP